MITLNHDQKQLAEQLLLCVKSGERTITYEALGKRTDPQQEPLSMDKPLGQVSTVCVQLHLPPLSAMVVNKSTRLAGSGFFALCERLGIPTDGKSESELWEKTLTDIQNCAEWFKLEDYLGFNIGMPRPAGAPPRLPPSYLDANRPVHYAKSVDVLNTCFGPRILGKEYGGLQRGAIEFEIDGKEYTVWFPKLTVHGEAAKSGWINNLSPDGMTINELGETSYTEFKGEGLVFAKEGDGPYLFRGVFEHKESLSTPNHHIFEKIADIADFTKSVPVVHYFDEIAEDAKLIEQLRGSDFTPSKQCFQFRGEALPVPEPKQVANHNVFPRNPQISNNALSHAAYKCELDPKHPTFIRRNADVPYTEPHHIVPVSLQDRFPVSLDVEENIVSLCSNCHNQIHYGKGAEQLIAKLYELRQSALESVGIRVTLEDLLSFYSLSGN